MKSKGIFSQFRMPFLCSPAGVPRIVPAAVKLSIDPLPGEGGEGMRPIEINRDEALKAFFLDPLVPSGLRWKHGPDRRRPGKMAGCLVDRGYKMYWQVIWRKKHYYAHRIVKVLEASQG